MNGGPPLRALNATGLGSLDGQHVEEAPEHGVHREQRGRPCRRSCAGTPGGSAPAAAPGARPPPESVPRRALLGGLRQRRELLVGHEHRRQRNLGAYARAGGHDGAETREDCRAAWCCPPVGGDDALNSRSRHKSLSFAKTASGSPGERPCWSDRLERLGDWHEAEFVRVGLRQDLIRLPQERPTSVELKVGRRHPEIVGRSRSDRIRWRRRSDGHGAPGFVVSFPVAG